MAYIEQFNSTPLSGNSGGDGIQSILDLLQESDVGSISTEKSPEKSSMLLNPETANSVNSGMRSGGASGALVSGGLSSMLGSGGMSAGGPYALAAGLVLSQIEARQKEDAEAQAQYEKDTKEQQGNLMSLASRRAQNVYKV